MTKQEMEDNGICTTCEGNGKYQVRKIETDGSVTIHWIFCEPCEGTGRESGDGDVD